MTVTMVTNSPTGRGTIKRLCFEHMAAAYDEASDGGLLPVPARQIFYALRRLTGLGDTLQADYVLKGARNTGLIDQYLDAHPGETAGWDVLRDARGNFVGRDGERVPLGTLDVRRYLDQMESHFVGEIEAPQFSLDYPKCGPGDSYGAVVFIEKEGFAEVIEASGVKRRRDLAVASTKGTSVRAARRLLAEVADRDVLVAVVHDFDVAGITLADLILAEVPEAVDLGLRWDDVIDPRWDLAGQAEGVTHRDDPRAQLFEHGATDLEIDFLAPTAHHGQRVELNALVGRRFITWLESKLDEHDVTKVIPDADVLEAAYRRARKLERINRTISELVDDVDDGAVPDDLVTMVTDWLGEHDTSSWDDAIEHVVCDDLDGEDDE